MNQTPELIEIADQLATIGITLDGEQIHIQGERFLMQKDKLVLTGVIGEKRVVIKASNKINGKQEIQNEKAIREKLESMAFAKEKILFPKEIFFGTKDDWLFWVAEYISQKKVFVKHDIEEQFFMLLRAFGAQESFHATTFEHMRDLAKTFEVFDPTKYLNTFFTFKIGNPRLHERAHKFLSGHLNVLSKYSDYLTHTDFVPHNFRVKGHQIYMLDLSAIHFGNKYEGWARLLNYMVIHEPELEKLLSKYLQQNREIDDNLALKLMRVYKLGFLLDFYTQSVIKTEGNLKTLTLERINFWQKIMNLILDDQEIPKELVEVYRGKRDKLRSIEEKERQREFAVA